MTVGHRVDVEELDDATISDLYAALGAGDTASLFGMPFRVDATFDIPTSGACSVDRQVVYIDRTLHAKTMDGAFKASGLTPTQIIRCWCEHEHSEACIVDGDNGIDTYTPAHIRALTREHEFVRAFGSTPEKYELAIAPGIHAAWHEAKIKKAPIDLWCGPILDEPDERGEAILEQLRKLGVKDASKQSKYDRHYGFGSMKCNACRHWDTKEITNLAPCKRISGLVQWDRHCDLWQEQK